MEEITNGINRASKKTLERPQGEVNENMEHGRRIFSDEMKRAINFAIKTHELDRKQKRKGKEVPYVVHPLAVGMILARVGAEEKVVIAGILHDTIEDSIQEQKVSSEMIAEQFGTEVADLVDSVTEPRKDLPWQERKDAALEHIHTLSPDGVLLKSADLVTNASEMLDDYAREGDAIFAQYNAPKEKIIAYFQLALKTTREQWPENPLAGDLLALEQALARIPQAG